MNHPLNVILYKILSRKLAVIVLLAASAMGAFATLGDGNKRTSKSTRSLLTDKVSMRNGAFSLKSGYSYRGNSIINTSNSNRYISLNTVVSYQRGHTAYVLPMKKKVVLDKLTFNPNAATRR